MRAVGTGWTPPGGTGPCFHWKPGLALARSSGGAYFGEVALIEHEPHNASVYAQGEVLLYGLHKSHFYDFRLSERLNFQLKYPVARNALQIIFGRTSRRIRSFYKVCFTLFLYLLVSGIMFHYLEGWGYSDCIYFAIITLMTVGYGDLVPKNWFSRIWLVLLILVSWVLVAHAIGEFLDRMVRLEMKNEKARKSLRLRRPRHEVFDEAGRRRPPHPDETCIRSGRSGVVKAATLQVSNAEMPGCFGPAAWLLFVSCLAAQTLVLEKPNWTDWTEALYFSVVTLATIGYGDDVTPKSEKSKLSIGLLALIGVPLFGLILGRIVQITYGKARRESLPEVCGGLTNETFDQLIDFTDQMWRAGAYNSQPQRSRREQITPFEFLCFMLTKNQAVTLEEIRVIMANFSELDVTKSGMLEQHDVDTWISLGSVAPPGRTALSRKFRKSSQLRASAMLGSEEVRQRMLRGPVLLVLVNSCEQIFIEMLLLYAVIDARGRTPGGAEPRIALGLALGEHQMGTLVPALGHALRRGPQIHGIAGTTFLFVYASVTELRSVEKFLGHEAHGLLAWEPKELENGMGERNCMELSMENSLVRCSGAPEQGRTELVSRYRLRLSKWGVETQMAAQSVFVFAAMLIFSVIWPYIKLLMMVYVWAAPVDPDTRGPALFFLVQPAEDRIGKWSLMDNIILFLFISFFWIAWVGEDVVSGGQATFGLRCSPGIELNTFLAATILSLLLGHAMLWVHRWYSPKEDCGATALSVGRSLFRGAAHRKLQILGLCQIGCILLTVASWQFEVVDVSFDGLVATFLKVTDQPISMRYSIMGLLSRLGKQGSRYLQVTFAIFVLIIPVLYLLAMAFLCLVKLQPKKQQLLLRLCYTLNAWAAYDVFLIAFLAAVLGGERYGIGQFIELVVYQQNLAPTCDALRDIGVSCMHVQLSLLPGALLILVAVVASFTVSLLASRELNMT
ncbi:Two-pore potassium channel 3 (AtTPK3) (Calcium-activated outward-rectifying potassium channel 6) (AtKCO6) [Durusdinium trenchii]|uniref:Two-pore potassium channel 3 (AtTPK3) (Calcium-activated outward-rectifying potassium channel 6) (AtKCO6) n=1 Tax=Durusdinium trenchii TaxID=1381693 RepID=A0ABP0Q5H1_9DINO